MKIGINLVGVSYNDGTKGGRYRNYEDAKDSFFKYIVNPLKEQGHEISFYIYSYYSRKADQIADFYRPKKYIFADESYNRLGGGDKIDGMRIISATHVHSLRELLGQNLHVIISTRFDLSPNENFPLDKLDFTKFNFLFREPEYTHLPIVCDTFFAFPYSMTESFAEAIIDYELNPYMGVSVAMHNIYHPTCIRLGKENVRLVTDEFYSSLNNPFYTLTRHE